MKITKINIPKTFDNNDGLEDIRMDKLGSIVLIAGKNGSGKTRILSKIFTTLQSKPIKNEVETANEQLEVINEALNNEKGKLERFNERITARKATNEAIWINRIQQAERNIENYKNVITEYKRILSWKNIETSELEEKYSSVKFVPKNLALADCSAYPKKQMLEFADSVNQVGVNTLPQGAFAKIQVIQDRWFNATHQNSQIPEADKIEAINDYKN